MAFVRSPFGTAARSSSSSRPRIERKSADFAGPWFRAVPLSSGNAVWLKQAMIEGGVEEREPGVFGVWAIAGTICAACASDSTAR